MSDYNPWKLANMLDNLIQEAQDEPQFSTWEHALRGFHEIEQEYVNAERRKAKAEALREAADQLEPGMVHESPYIKAGRDIIRIIRDRADQIEEDGGEA